MVTGLVDVFVGIVGPDPIAQGLAGGLVIAFLNLVGASIVLVWRDPTAKWLDGALGFAAGVMLSASFTSLLLPGIEFASRPGYQGVGIGGVELAGIAPVMIGLFLGAIALDRGEDWVAAAGPLIGTRLVDEVRSNGSGRDRATCPSAVAGRVPPRVRSVLFFTVAVTLHNMPEGLAVGVGFGSGDIGNAVSLMLAIGIQNIPEGLAVSVAAINAGFGRRWYAAVTGIRAGLVEIPFAVLGAWLVTAAAPLLPYAMGFAAGGMLYVIAIEIIPETHTQGYERVATFGLVGGAALMLVLDVALA